MGCGKPTDEDNPLVPFKQSNQFALAGGEASDSDQISHVNNISASAFMPIPFASVSNSHWENAQGMHQSYSQDPGIFNNMSALLRLGTSQNAHSNLRNQYNRPSGLNHPLVNMNFPPNLSTIPGGYCINAQGGEGKASDGNCSQSTGSSLYMDCNPSGAQSTRDNDARGSVSYPGKIDGSFLTLGIGANVESRTKNKYSAREIASHLEESHNFPVAQTDINFPTLGYNLTGSSSFQSNPSGFPGSIYSSLGAFSSPVFQSSNMPEALKQYDFFESSDRNLGLTSISPRTYQANSPHEQYQGDPATVFSPFNSTNISTLHSGFSQYCNLTSESSMLMGTTSQPTPIQPQNYHPRNVRDVPSFFGSNSINVMGNPVTQDYLGNQIPVIQSSSSQAIGGGSSMSAQPIGHISSTLGVNSGTHLGSTNFPGKVLSQIAGVTATKPATVSPFPRRLGVQPDDGPQSVNQGMNPRVMGVQTRSRVNQSQPVQLTKSLDGSPSGTGNPQGALPHQSNVRASLFSSGLAPLSAKVDQPSQMSNAIGQSSLKREAVDPLVASWGRRRKLFHLPTALNSISQRQGTADVLPPVPSGNNHIRWQGFAKPPQLVGHRCLLCNRDLSFTPEGPVYQPSMPPAVAVLPCGHTFHDHCLERITPEDQITDPPCIPCAIGEAS